MHKTKKVAHYILSIICGQKHKPNSAICKEVPVTDFSQKRDTILDGKMILCLQSQEDGD